MSGNRATEQDEIGILIAALQKSKMSKGWIVVRTVEEVPAEVGHYAIYDGIDVRGAGVTWNMRKSLEQSGWFGRCEKPIYMYLPDDQAASAAKYMREAGFK